MKIRTTEVDKNVNNTSENIHHTRSWTENNILKETGVRDLFSKEDLLQGFNLLNIVNSIGLYMNNTIRNTEEAV